GVQHSGVYKFVLILFGLFFFFFFFQAEDGIRDRNVTGVQTCALPISTETSGTDGMRVERDLFLDLFGTDDQREGMRAFLEKRSRSEERRVGKECRSRWAP